MAPFALELSGENKMAKKSKSDDFSAKTGAATAAPTQLAHAATPAKTTARAPTQEQISHRAYEIWMARGKSPGGEVADWLQAEKQLTQQLGPMSFSTANPESGCTTSFFLEERDEMGKVCAIEPDPKTEYVQPESEKEDGGEG
jgi:hypothetical protein